ncbi:MAG: hypothetical protein H0X36_09565 [Sphingomonadaceae bacterium]|nr:hypothetical protein [Sphingomonadaceae bacterium]
MIDNFSLGLTHALLLLAAWRLVFRADLDREDKPAPADPEAQGGWGQR